MNYVIPWIKNDGTNLEVINVIKESLCDKHLLFGCEFKILANRQDCDDYFIEILNSKLKFAVIHPTYSFENDPRWPSMEIYDDEIDFKVKRHDPDVLEWNL